MKTLVTVPAGVRLDAWPETPPSAAERDTPEVAQLREEFRKSMPQVASVLETLSKLQHMRDLAGRVAGPQPATIIQHRS